MNLKIKWVHTHFTFYFLLLILSDSLVYSANLPCLEPLKAFTKSYLNTRLTLMKKSKVHTK